MEKKYQGQFGIPFSRIAKDREIPYIVPLRYRALIGIVGLKYAGKTMLSSYLVEDLGFRFYSLSRIVRAEADRFSIPVGNRTALQDLGDELRREYGHDILARRLLREIYRDLIERQEDTPYIVIDGIKNVAEVEVLARLPEFTLIGVRASPSARYRRALQDKSFIGSESDFIEHVDKRDKQTSNAHGQQVEACLQLVASQHTIDNESAKEETLDKLRSILRRAGALPFEP